ncbi:hypothetical protein [Ramlibacter sp.]|uniref:hypothetical protein n=1 Tax=Ramlibacter sp. TaxID=1917967 RepID=UPI003D09BC01
MTSIDSTRQLLAQLQRETVALRRAGPAVAAKAAVGSTRTHAKRGQTDPLATALRAIAALDATCTQTPQQAFRAYLGAVLAAEFGAAMAHGPGFAALVDRVRDGMRADPETAREIEEAGQVLLKTARGGTSG